MTENYDRLRVRSLELAISSLVGQSPAATDDEINERADAFFRYLSTATVMGNPAK